MNTSTLLRATLVASVALAAPLAAQVQTEVPPVVAGATPASTSGTRAVGAPLGESAPPGEIAARSAAVPATTPIPAASATTPMSTRRAGARGVTASF